MIPKIIRPGLSLLLLAVLSGCNTVVMNPAGDIARQQADLIKISVWLMLIIIVPVMILTVVFAWKYRKGANAKYEPDWDHSTKLELVIWGAPLLIIIALGLITWISTHKLDPYRPLDRLDANRPIPAGTKVLEVQVVSLDWKWMFIYPEQGIATINELVTPIDTPIRFKMTSSTVMNTFYIPTLAGMIYTMPAMETTLNAVLNKTGDYKGMSANFSGDGFSHMRFAYRGTTQAGFEEWVAKVKSSNAELDRARYLALEKPSEKEPIRHFGSVDPSLYMAVLNRCVAPGAPCMHQQMAQDAQRVRNALDLKGAAPGAQPVQAPPDAHEALIRARTPAPAAAAVAPETGGAAQAEAGETHNHSVKK